MSTDSLADLVRLAAKLNIRPNLIYKLLRLHYIDPLEPKTHKFFFFRGDFDLYKGLNKISLRQVPTAAQSGNTGGTVHVRSSGYRLR